MKSQLEDTVTLRYIKSQLWNIGLVSQTGFRLNQHYVIVQLGHLSNVYKRALEKTITAVHFWDKIKALIYFKISQSKFILVETVQT